VSIDDQALQRLADDLTNCLTDGSRPVRPMGEIRARAAVLRRRRRVGGVMAGMVGVGLTVVAVGAGVGATAPVVTPAARTGTGRPPTRPAASSDPSIPMPVIALASDAICNGLQHTPLLGGRVDAAEDVSRIPARLLVLPDAGGTPDSVTGGSVRCATAGAVIHWYRGGRTSGAPTLAVSGPDDPYPCSTSAAPARPLGDQQSTARARGVPVTIHHRAGAQQPTCAVWTERGGGRWFALSTETDAATLLRWIGQLRLTPVGVDPASPVTGLTQLGSGDSYRPPGAATYGPARRFLESHGTASGGWSLLAVDQDGLSGPVGPGVTPAWVRGVAAWWIVDRSTLLWHDATGVWFALRTGSTVDTAIRLAESVRPVPAADPRWAVYLSSARGYHGTPEPVSPAGATPSGS